MVTTETKQNFFVQDDIIEHEAIQSLPMTVDTSSDTEAVQVGLSKRDLARQQRAQLLQQQAQLQQLLDEIDDDSHDNFAQLHQQVQTLSEEVANWKAPENPHSVLAQIGLFALIASLICWLVAPFLSGQGAYLEGALHTAAVLLGYVAAALLLFMLARNKQH